MPHIEFTHLSPRERLELIQDLWESLESSDIRPTPAQAEELDRRIEHAESDLPSSTSWDAIRAEAASRYR